MKRIVTLLLFLIIGQACFSATVLRVGKMYTAAVPLPHPNILHEDFETGAVPAGWHSDSPAPDWGNATDPLLGTYSMVITNSGTGTYLDPAIDGQTTVYALFMFKASAFTSAPLLDLENAGASSVAHIRVTAGGALQVMDQGNDSNDSSVNVMSINTLYYIWVKFVAGSGANAEITAAFSTTQSRPTDDGYIATISNGNCTGARVNYTWYGLGGNTRIDHFGLDTANPMTLGWVP